jgi:hypothetical protein
MGRAMRGSFFSYSRSAICWLRLTANGHELEGNSCDPAVVEKELIGDELNHD